MAGVHASALMRVLWTRRLSAEEAEQVITSESLIAQKGERKTQAWEAESHVAAADFVPVCPCEDWPASVRILPLSSSI